MKKIILFLISLVLSFGIGYFAFFFFDTNKEPVSGQETLPISIDGVNITKEIYDNEQLLIFANIGEADINSLLRTGMGGMYEIVDQAFSRNEEDENVVVYMTNDNKEKVGAFLYTRSRYNGISQDIKQEAFKRHVRVTGWDVLNNSTKYWFEETYKSNINKSLDVRLLKENQVENLE